MYLKSLEVHGFKSFANKLVFEFHDGITAIVGPNGSGKSNVADAMRWVLGEQSAKQLRGARMEDVIFAGTELRKPLGYAYVAVTINNEDHKLDVPYNEVKIARRVYRSGESEYLLNGTVCRLRDVQELLFDTGIGKEGYSIIGQGQIDKILSGKPEERRELFDEAAGIVKYKKRKAAAEKNLEEEKQNLVRIEDILSELSKQVVPLEKQAQKAKEYLRYRDELKNLDINLFLTEYEKTGSVLKEVEKKKAIARGDLDTAKAGFEESKRQYGELEDQLNSLNNNIEEQNESLAAKKVLLNDYENDIKLLNEQINAIHQSRQHYKEQIDSFNVRMSALSQELEDYNAQNNINSTELDKLSEAREQNKEKLKEVLDKTDINNKETIKYQGLIMELMEETTSLKEEENKLQMLSGQNNIKKAGFAQRIIKNKSSATAINETMEKEKKTLADISEKLVSLEAARKENIRLMDRLDADDRNIREEYHEAEKQFHIGNSRLVSLKNMAERYDGFGQSIKRVMEQKEKHAGIIGVVADIIQTSKEYETAIETALGGSIQNIVTDNAQTAKDMIQFLKKNKYGRATFLPLTNIKAGKEVMADGLMEQKGVIGSAASLAVTDAKFAGLVKYLLGRYLVVDNIDNAMAIAARYHHTIRIVTKEGDLLNPGGSMSGGAFKNSANLLGRRREMEDLEEKVKGLDNQIALLSGKIKDIEDKKAAVLEKSSANGNLMQELVLKQNTAKINYNRALADFKASGEELARIYFESRETEAKDKELKKALNEAGVKLSANNAKNQLYEDKLALLKKELEELQNLADSISQENSTLMVNITSLEGKHSFINENINRINHEKADIQEGLDEVTENSRNTGRRISEKEQEIEGVIRNIGITKQEIEELSKGLEKKKESQKLLLAEHKKCLSKREELSELINNLDKECFRLNSQMEKLDSQINAFTDYMWEQYGLTYHGAEELKTVCSLDFEEMKKRTQELKSSIKLLGDVNVNAVEQYNELMERYELLTGQHADLTDAADVLAGIIEELDTEMRRQFEVQFAGINKRFDYVFKELFGGGRGTIGLVEGEDILVAGINIIAQPPGKKLQNMMQLSGGEKALTAIALLFAIQSLKPSPFCLLDEIEAALDDSNVGRYAQYLHKLTKDTQFIVITHRRGTMNAADILYGITMQEKGVSTLVSVNLLEDKE